MLVIELIISISFSQLHILPDVCDNFASKGQRVAFFHSYQQAFAVRENKSYYRSMYSSDKSSKSWNIRDTYMYQTVLTIREYLNNPNTLVWAHSSHLGDARATSMGEFNEFDFHYTGTMLMEQFDAIYYIDTTSALKWLRTF